jgi:hypothetical protein
LDRRLVIGVVVVGLCGVGLAMFAVGGAGGPPRVEPVVERAPVARAKAAAKAGATGPRTPRAVPDSDPDEAALSTDRPPPPRSPIAPGTFEPFEVEHDRLVHQQLFADLTPDEDPAIIAERVAATLDEVHELATDYWELGQGAEPAVRGEALQRAALVYERFVEQLPPPAVGDAPDDGTPGWSAEEHEALVTSLRDKVEALRQASVPR